MWCLTLPDFNENFAEQAERSNARFKEEVERIEREERERELRRKELLSFALRGTLLLVILVTVALLIDGLHRENAELLAHIRSFVPSTNIQRGLESSTTPAKVAMDLAHKDLVITDQSGKATLTFPDGSGILVQPASRFEVRLVDYSRNGKRNRSFILRYGSLFSYISKAFGQGGQTLISTPNAVAAARGTGYTVLYSPDNKQTVVEVIESKVVLKNAGGRVEITAGHKGVATGNAAPEVFPLDGPRRGQLSASLTQMKKLDSPPFPLLLPLFAAEKSLITVADPLLQGIGFVPGGWNIQENDTARRLQATKRLQDLQKALADDLPDQLTLHTLAELSLPEEEKEQILSAFANEMLDGYQKSGTSGYTVRARARDSTGTSYELTETGVHEVKP